MNHNLRKWFYFWAYKVSVDSNRLLIHFEGLRKVSQSCCPPVCSADACTGSQDFPGGLLHRHGESLKHLAQQRCLPVSALTGSWNQEWELSWLPNSRTQSWDPGPYWQGWVPTSVTQSQDPGPYRQGWVPTSVNLSELQLQVHNNWNMHVKPPSTAWTVS